MGYSDCIRSACLTRIMPASSQESARKRIGVITGSVERFVDNSTLCKEKFWMPPLLQSRPREIGERRKFELGQLGRADDAMNLGYEIRTEVIPIQ